MKTFKEFISEDFTSLSVKPNYKYEPKTKEELVMAIREEIAEQGPEADLNCIDTSEITDMCDLFDRTIRGYSLNFNGDISQWDVSNVTNMFNMFNGCTKFNCDISGWDVSKATNMGWMFNGCKEFNQDLSGWNVSGAKSMNYMFYGCESFNQDLSKWDVSKVIFAKEIFVGCPILREYKPDLQV